LTGFGRWSEILVLGGLGCCLEGAYAAKSPQGWRFVLALLLPPILIAPYKVPFGKGIREVQMLDITKDIQSLTTFRRSSGHFMEQLRKTKRPVVLTVNGRAAAVVQDAEAYQRLLDIAASADAGEGIRQGLEDAARGRIRPAAEFFNEFEAKHGLPG
jgi:prevent-host-death family protein